MEKRDLSQKRFSGSVKNLSRIWWTGYSIKVQLLYKRTMPSLESIRERQKGEHYLPDWSIHNGSILNGFRNKHFIDSSNFLHFASLKVEDRTQDVISPDSEEADDSTNGDNNNALESPSNPKPPKVKSFLYTHLKEQPIWKCQRFWNASFFESVHHERTQHSPDGKRGHWRHMSSEEQELAEIMEENITFGQLATFLHNMMGLGLSEQFTRRFLDKMGVIGNITKDQYDMLAANIASHFKATSHFQPASGKETRQWSLSNLGTPIRRRLSSLMKQPSKH
ncbi:uncharacterized protein KIAA0513 isoform X2 [Strongylocentrotus purpuratus]|uniref:SBF1/SBF2 domain-containing protein n=1 Tax=Strongylocentrotus purpuratus TaxID=7668 RepID=A0A7M7N4G3_STRPU|nr:uncharacterized protein KIAA0513 isoform X2 [Strongylocentrotus purpuratus]XP_030831111.1 uncharacterized protein KIAA0513 isoform X2 [Strongylocentrotus purpuratus]